MTPIPSRDSRLSELVRRTEGVQPWRRAFHAANGVFLVLALKTLPIGTWTAAVLLGTVLSVLVLVDGVRLANPSLNRLFFQAFSHLASPREAGGLASSTWYLLGVVLTLMIFPRHEALAGILVLALADPAAGFVGRSWGKRRLGTGTVEGTLTFAVVAFLTLLAFAPWRVALATAVVTALVERTPWSLDDNLVLPPTVAALLYFLPGP